MYEMDVMYHVIPAQELPASNAHIALRITISGLIPHSATTSAQQASKCQYETVFYKSKKC